MSTRQQIILLLEERAPGLRHTAAHIWDVLEAARGLTVVMIDGTVYPVPCGRGIALQLLASWAIETRAN